MLERQFQLRYLLATTLAVSVASTAVSQDDSNAAYVPTRDFKIPIILKIAPEQIRSMHLWMSHNQGGTWKKLPNKITPEQKDIRMRAKTDGEYWFTLAYTRTDGRTIPSDVEGRPPAMRVIIDTEKPDIALRPLPARNEKAGVAWTIRDNYADLSSLRVRLRTEKDPAWHDLRVDMSLESKIEWPTDPGDNYIVEVAMKDKAGNAASSTIDIPGPSASGERARPLPSTLARQLDTPRDREFARDRDMPNGFGDPLGEPPPPMVAKRNTESGPGPMAPPPMTPPPIKFESKPILPTETKHWSEPKMTWEKKEAEVYPDMSSKTKVFDPTKVDLPPDRPPTEVVARRVDEGKPTNSTEEDVRQAGYQHQAKKIIEEPKIKLANSPRMQIGYSVEGVGVAGVGSVELFMTRDNGQTWEKCCDDPDLESPIDVKLPGDGSYGLTIVVKNKAMVGDRPPVPGEQPQMRVDVDTDAPYAEISRVTPDPEAPRESMLLQWSTEDKHPSERAVDLFFSHDPSRGWYKIAGGLPPSGTHSWKVPMNIPHQVYFCLVARDQAGNEEKIRSNKPVIVDLSSPQGRINTIINVMPEKRPSR